MGAYKRNEVVVLKIGVFMDVYFLEGLLFLVSVVI